MLWWGSGKWSSAPSPPPLWEVQKTVYLLCFNTILTPQGTLGWHSKWKNQQTPYVFGVIHSKTYKNLWFIAYFEQCPPPWGRPRVGVVWRPFGSGLETIWDVVWDFVFTRDHVTRYHVTRYPLPAIQYNSTKICNFESNAIHIQCNPIDIHSIQTIQSFKATQM